MSKSKLMRSMSIVMAAAMMSGLTACGGGGSTQTTAAPAETKAEAAASEANGEKKEEAAAATEELVAEDGAEIEVAYWEGSTSDKEAWDELLANLQKDHPEIKIIPQTYPSSDFRDMLDTRIAGNDWPDVIRYTYQRLGKFKKADVMLDLSPYISKESLDGISPAFLLSHQLFFHEKRLPNWQSHRSVSPVSLHAKHEKSPDNSPRAPNGR